VGAASEADPQAGPDATRIDARKSVVMPGFVDAHTHPVFAGTREDEYEMRAAGSLISRLHHKAEAFVPQSERLAGFRRRPVRDGIAASAKLARARHNPVEAKSGYGLTLDDELKILRVIRRLNAETPLELIPTFLGAHESRTSIAALAKTTYAGD